MGIHTGAHTLERTGPPRQEAGSLHKVAFLPVRQQRPTRERHRHTHHRDKMLIDSRHVRRQDTHGHVFVCVHVNIVPSVCVCVSVHLFLFVADTQTHRPSMGLRHKPL
eukprot:GHVQ01040490.1.p1 GENE.GHVQ01040490.1~~GHVQ01040490.1.p1  ORF type:complete len:108 (+),score=21.05 GHVQ01040490.1:82-405(+)